MSARPRPARRSETQRKLFGNGASGGSWCVDFGETRSGGGETLLPQAGCLAPDVVVGSSLSLAGGDDVGELDLRFKARGRIDQVKSNKDRRKMEPAFTARCLSCSPFFAACACSTSPNQ